MARIRSVHPSLFSDEGWVSCSAFARLLYIGLWTDADDQGVFEWRPMQLKMRLMPADSVDVGALLQELAGVDLLRSFEVDGRTFGAIKEFQKFQRPRKPNAVHPLPANQVAYVLGEPDQTDLFGEQESELTPVKATSVPQKSEKSPQMEDGGWRMEDGVSSTPKGASKRRKPETAIPDGFPDQRAIMEAEARCTAASAEVNVGIQAERFRGHAETNDRRCRDWAAAFRTWVAKSIESAPKSNVVQLNAPPSAERQRAWMTNWQAKPFQWDRFARGPAPDDPDCVITDEVMAEFGHHRTKRRGSA